jgi:hypothetical protein
MTYERRNGLRRKAEAPTPTWLACDFMSQVVGLVLKEFLDLEKLSNSDQALASHATDFERQAVRVESAHIEPP